MNHKAAFFGRSYRGGWFFMLAALLIAMVPAAGHAAVTITVTSLSDPSASGQCTLRDAIYIALGLPLSSASDQCTTLGTGTNYTIVFAGKLAGGTIQIGSELADFPSGASLAITGPQGEGVTINGENHQIFAVDSGATLSLQYLTLTGAIAGNGGAIGNSGTLIVTNSTFTDDKAAGGGSGGAIFNGGTVTVTNSTFASNNATGGGAIFQPGGTLTITSSTFTNNSTNGVDVGGGAIESDSGTMTVTNATFDGNSSPFGGAINNGGTLTVTNSTFANNSAGEGGALFNGGPANFKGTILAANSGGNCFNLSGVTDNGYNLADDDSCAFTSPSSQNNEAAIDLDPSGLQNNGGPTQTIALLAGSVAINAIPVADCTDQSDPPVQLTTDQRGVLRPQGPACDIGAYEYDTARSLKTAALAAIQALSGGNRHDRQELSIAASNLALALRYYWQGNSGNVLNPVLGILDFLAEGRAVNALQQILTPASQLPAAAIENYTFNIALADRTLAEVAISGGGGNTQASQLVANGDAASAAGNYSLAITYYSKAWQIVR